MPAYSNALVFDAVTTQAVEHGDEDRAFELAQQLRRDRRRRAVRAHAAGHRAGVAVVDRLVVLRGFHQVNVAAVDERHHADFGAAHELFDDDACAGIAEDLLSHDLVNRIDRVGLAVTDLYALALGKAGGFDHDRRGPHFDVLLGGVGVRETAGLGGRDGLAAHQFLGEPLVAFQPGCLLARAEDAQAGFLQAVGKAERQRVFRADHDEVDRIVLGEAFDFDEIGPARRPRNRRPAPRRGCRAWRKSARPAATGPASTPARAHDRRPQ